MSFIGIDQNAYVSGLILFYEKGDTSLLSETIADAYVENSKSYAAAVATKRMPRSIELKERQRVDRLVRKVIEEQIEGDDIQKMLKPELSDLSDEDQAFLSERIESIVSAITEDNAAAWGVDGESVKRYRNSASGMGM